MSLEAFGVKNLRCLTDTGLVPIKPVTVLVGRNSSGKSTFLRAFPLLRQSVQTERNSPILWGGDDTFVDFGSFEVAANAELTEPSVTFAFRVQQGEDPPFDVATTLGGGEIPYVSGYELRADAHVFRWGFDTKGRALACSVDGIAIQEGPLVLGGWANLLPSMQPAPPEQMSDPAGVVYRSFRSEDAGGYLAPTRYGGPVLPWAAARSSDLIEIADFIIAGRMRRVAYLGPTRAPARRFYRLQNLAVDEVDHDGTNLAMFLRSLSPDETESLAVLTRRMLGFETEIKTTGMNCEIRVKENTSRRFFNIVDVGFGYAEILPLAAVLWTSTTRPESSRRPRPSLVTLEQPELHLHPAQQANLAGMLVDAVKRSPSARVIVETHSETVINGLGRLVYDGAIKASDVQIVLFDKDETTGQTTVGLTGYDDDGALQDSWPYGFLAQRGERLIRPAAE